MIKREIRVWNRRGRGEGEEEENMRDYNGRDGERSEGESKTKDILTDIFIWLASNPVLGKLPSIHKDDPK